MTTDPTDPTLSQELARISKASHPDRRARLRARKAARRRAAVRALRAAREGGAK